jgi:hypothetical protein
MKKYGVITNTSVHHEGDERSRTNPGHGYPAYTENITTFKTFKDEDDMLRYRQRWSKDSDIFIEYGVVTFETTVKMVKA